jgi:hypothetical protein
MLTIGEEARKMLCFEQISDDPGETKELDFKHG